MSIIHASTVGRPIWIDLTSSDPAASRAFYAKVLGWQMEVTTDPQFGGYAIARSGGKDVAGIGPAMMADAPSAWSVYIGTDDATELTARVQAAGGMVVAPPMQVGDAGRMAVFADPSGAVIGAWQPGAMPGFVSGTPNGFTWAELNRGASIEQPGSTGTCSAGLLRPTPWAKADRPTPSSSSGPSRWPAAWRCTRRPRPGCRATGGSSSQWTMRMQPTSAP